MWKVKYNRVVETPNTDYLVPSGVLPVKVHTRMNDRTPVRKTEMVPSYYTVLDKSLPECGLSVSGYSTKR